MLVIRMSLLRALRYLHDPGECKPNDNMKEGALALSVASQLPVRIPCLYNPDWINALVVLFHLGTSGIVRRTNSARVTGCMQHVQVQDGYIELRPAGWIMCIGCIGTFDRIERAIIDHCVPA